MKRTFVLVLGFCLSLAPSLMADAGTSSETSREVARRIILDVLGSGRFELVEQLYAPDFVNHGRSRDVGLAVDTAAARGWRQAVPDMEMSSDLTVAEGDMVAVLWRAAGTNSGEGNGLPATGRRISGRGITIWRVVDGKVREEWSEFNMLSMLRQTGLVPGGSAEETETDTRPHLYEPANKQTSQEQRERNRATAALVFEEIVGKGRLELFDSIYEKDFRNHGSRKDSTIQDEIEGTRGFRELSPDLKTKVDITIAEGDLVTVLWTAQGTHTGTALGLTATGKTFHLRGISIFRFGQSGKIREEWSVLDLYATLIELGILPKPGA